MTRYQLFVLGGAALFLGMGMPIPNYSQTKGGLDTSVPKIPIVPPTLKDLEKKEAAQDKKIEKLAVRFDSTAVILKNSITLKDEAEKTLDNTSTIQKQSIELIDMLPKVARKVSPPKPPAPAKLRLKVPNAPEPVTYTEIETVAPAAPCVDPAAAKPVKQNWFKRLFKRNR